MFLSYITESTVIYRKARWSCTYTAHFALILNFLYHNMHGGANTQFESIFTIHRAALEHSRSAISLRCARSISNQPCSKFALMYIDEITTKQEIKSTRHLTKFSKYNTMCGLPTVNKDGHKYLINLVNYGTSYFTIHITISIPNSEKT